MIYEDDVQRLVGKTLVSAETLGDPEPEQLVLHFEDGTHATVRMSTVSNLLTLDMYHNDETAP